MSLLGSDLNHETCFGSSHSCDKSGNSKDSRIRKTWLEKGNSLVFGTMPFPWIMPPSAAIAPTHISESVLLLQGKQSDF